MLLNPTTKEMNTTFGKFHKGREKDNLCKLGFIKIMNEKELNLNIGIDILKLLGKETLK